MRASRAVGLAKGLLVTGCLLVPALCPAMVTLPWSDDFSAPKLNSPWSVHLAAGNRLELTNHMLVFTGPANSLAAGEYPLHMQQARVACQIKSSAYAGAVIVLTWDNSNYLQSGLNHRADGHLDLREVLGTYPHDFDLGPMDGTKWHTLLVQLSPPVWEAPSEIMLRLRDPGHRRIAHVVAMGAVKIRYTGDTLRLTQCRQPVVLAVTFK